MREIEFRAKSKKSKKWIYGNLIIKKTKLSAQALDKELFDYKYSIQHITKNNKTTIIEVDKDTIRTIYSEQMNMEEYMRT